MTAAEIIRKYNLGEYVTYGKNKEGRGYCFYVADNPITERFDFGHSWILDTPRDDNLFYESLFASVDEKNVLKERRIDKDEFDWIEKTVRWGSLPVSFIIKEENKLKFFCATSYGSACRISLPIEKGRFEWLREGVKYIILLRLNNFIMLEKDNCEVSIVDGEYKHKTDYEE